MQLIIGNKNYSSWSLRPWYLMRRTGIDFDETCLRFGVDFAARIGEYSGARRVPVLIDGDRHVWESLAICEYLAERFPEKRLWPADVGERAWARSIAAEMHAGFGALRDALPMNCRAADRRVEIGADVARDIERIQAVWRECRETFADAGPWLFGAFSVADAMFVPVASRLRTYGIDLGTAESVYVQTVLGDPVYLQWIADARVEPEVVEHEEVGIVRAQQ